MHPTISFGEFNSALQVGVNHGTINAECHFPISELRETLFRIDRTDLHMDLDDKLPIVHGAAFDSLEDQHEDECLPGTRTDLLYQIGEWTSSLSGPCIFWLNGMAGTGKSTISRTVARSSSQAKSLGASFFFKRGKGDRGNATKLFPTIAGQLANSLPRLVPEIRKAVQNDPAIATKGIREQFDKLLLQPLLSLRLSDHPIQAVVILIDALDECEGEKDIRLILQLLPQLQKPTAVRLRVFLTSRPELAIRLGFKSLAHRDHKDLVLHEIPPEVIENDISLFLNHRLSEIKKEREPPLPVDWPGATNVRNLVRLSVPLFIFAATICRIFEDPDWDPMDSLPEILTHQKDESKLDGTYLPVLNRLLNRQNEKRKKQLVKEFQQVVGAIVMLESPLSVISLSRLLGLSEKFIHLRLNPLHSVLSVPDDETLSVRIFHLSFRDFLLDPETREKSPFWVDEKEMHHRLTTRCLLLCQNLRKNICGLPSDGTQRAEIDQQSIDRCLSPELQYSCRYWAHHLVQCTDLNAMMRDALLFLQRHFLHWVEAMSLLGLSSEVVGIINLLQSVIPSDNHSAMSDFLHDAKRFILKSLQIADAAPLQLYCSGLIFAPRQAIIRKKFETELPAWIHQLPEVEERWSAELQTLEGHSGSVNSVAFSPDGRLLASGSSDQTVRLWDSATGALQQTLRGHSSSVQSVSFSSDSYLLVSDSIDKTIRLWDSVTGALQQALQGRSSSVKSVAYSPDGRMLASYSTDETVRLWDSKTGALQHTLKGHSGSIRSVALSPDGRLLASGSTDKTVRLWDTATGALQQTLQGHSSSVQSVAFSPDGRLLASGSSDQTVRLWDPATGSLQQAPQGRSSPIKSVAYSPDGCMLASYSTDETVRLWDSKTGALQHTLKGHSGSIRSVAFSPDGRLLASSSFDRKVRLWNTRTGALQQTLRSSVQWMTFSPNGRMLASGSSNQRVQLWDTVTGTLRHILWDHSNSAFSLDSSQLSDTVTDTLWEALEGNYNSVVFSPNGRLLASGSFDQEVRLWNTRTGALRHSLKGHSGSIKSMAFSPDGRLLASGSFDQEVRLWNTRTGALQQTHEGHSSCLDDLQFSQAGLYLRTNLGFIHFQSKFDPHSPPANLEISIQEGQWITLNGGKMLWLPPDFRPYCSAAKDSAFALGRASGRVSFMGFSV